MSDWYESKPLRLLYEFRDTWNKADQAEVAYLYSRPWKWRPRTLPDHWYKHHKRT